MVENSSNEQLAAPIPIKVLSVVYYVLAVACLVGLILSLLFVIKNDANDSYSFFISSIFVVLSISLILIMVLFFFVGRGLWKGEKWSKAAAITISIITILVVIAMIIILSNLSEQLASANPDYNSLGNVASLLDIFDLSKFIPKVIIISIINVIIIGYLLLNKKTKEFFERR